MLVNPRRGRRSARFTSRLRDDGHRRRQHVAAAYSTAIVEAVLAVAMIVAAVRAYQAVQTRASGFPLAARLALPVLFVLGALFAFRSCVKNIQSVREFSQFRRPDGER